MAEIYLTERSCASVRVGHSLQETVNVASSGRPEAPAMTTEPSPSGSFGASRARFEILVGFLEGANAAALSHAELEDRLQVEGRELIRRLLQDHLDLRAGREKPIAGVEGADGVDRSVVERGHERGLATVFGEVTVRRMAYRRRGSANLHPADSMLNLPVERHSHGLRELAAVESSRGSFDDAVEAIRGATGVQVGKRQVEELAGRAAIDFEPFYAASPRPTAEAGEVVVLSADGKGIVMRPEALRPATAAAAAASASKLATRLSKGEKRNRKRMAEVGVVYDLTPVPRTPADILGDDKAAPAPTARRKWLTASVAEDAASVVAKIFAEAERRDPTHERTWVALVDGNNHQLDRIRAEARDRGVALSIMVDFIHVLEYLWRAAWSFYDEGDPEAEAWVRSKALAVLQGEASTVAASVRRKATCLGLDASARANADACADYLLRKRPYLDYPAALNKGWPISTGVIEGACRHLVKDRMDLTGARWRLKGAEGILKLRALRINGDFDSYWAYHLAQEQRRVHESRYANGVIPQAA